MNISPVSSLINYQTRQPCLTKYTHDSAAQNKNKVETSIYNTKGANVYFGSLAKAQDAFEAECIQILRKVRNHRCRMFDEYDITEMLGSLRKEQNPANKTNVLKEIFCLESEEYAEKPDKNFLKRVLNLTAGRPEDERFAILEFAQYEFTSAKEPIAAFASLPKEKQDKLVKLLKDIDNVNTINSESEYYNPEAMYDTFRTLVYAEDDLARIKGGEADTYKVNTYHTLKDDIEYFKNLTYPDENIKQRVIPTVEKILNYFLENIL